MAQINCPECNHLMSDQAKICPSCFAPRKVANTKNCVNCGQEIEARKKKCPHCGVLQESNNKLKSNKQMATKNNSTNFFLISILMLIIGAGLMYFLAPIINSESENALTNEYAKVKKINDLYVFIESTPADPESYTTIETMEGDNLIDIVNSLGIGKEKPKNVFANIVNTLGDNLTFDKLLDKITEKAHSQYPDATGVIFSDRMKKCQVIKFKNN